VRNRLARYGLAIVSPRWALAVADDPAEPGRASTDLLVLFVAMLFAVHLRALVGAVWLFAVAGASIGARALLMVASRAFTTDLAFLLIGSIVVFAAGGPKRALGRAFDLACVAIVPLVALEAVATAIVRALELPQPEWLGMILSLAGFTWSGAILALALVQMRRKPRAPKPGEAPPQRAAGIALAAVLALGMIVQAVWVARHLDYLRPMTSGDPAPELALPRIEQGGALGPRVSLSSLKGKVVIVDVWATWCRPCLDSLPHVAELAARTPGLAVVAVNIDDAEKARALFDQAGYAALTLVFDDEHAADRLGATVIPHTIVIDRDGTVRGVFRGDPEGALALAGSLVSSK